MRSIAEIVAEAAPTANFPCVLRLSNDDPCKGWCLEIHTIWNLDDSHPLNDADDTIYQRGAQLVADFVAMAPAALRGPDCSADMRIRLMGNSGEWAMYEFTSVPEDELDIMMDRFTAAYGHRPIR